MIAPCYFISMDMRTFISRFPDQLGVVAETAGTKPIYLRQIANGHRQPSFAMALRLEEATSGTVTKSDLRPDIWPPIQAGDRAAA